ncbi:MAG TPA: tetratricopeptide repeat protein [Candidatus Sulfotelmatobacter sp.]|jgi:predicted negative regulator of RcsB-dependent stress response|nr:tetratricopeptide repeat protein [Candidatus Sulfotelmatobacter sp.]
MQTTTDAPTEFILKFWPWLEANKNRLIIAVVVVVGAYGVYCYSNSQKAQKEISAGEALTQLLMTPPAGVNAADALSQLAARYPGTAAAQRAQLQSAATLFGGGHYPEAQAAFQKFLDSNSSGGPLAAIAQMGVAASLEAQNKLDDAATAYQKVSTTYANQGAALPALCALGRIAEEQGHLTEALGNYQAAAHAGQAGGSLAQQAQIAVVELQAKIAAQKPAAPAAPAATTPAFTPSFLPAK